MPLYEYECERCGARFELIQKFADPPAETCKTCGGPVHRLLSAPAIQFKGSGWYITDYARKCQSDSSGSSGSSSHSTSSGNGKPASSSPASGDSAKPSPPTSSTTPETKST